MTLAFSMSGKVKIIMVKYITKNMLKDVPPKWDGEVVTAAANHLFEVNTKALVMLDEEKAMIFHHHGVQLLLLCKWAWPTFRWQLLFFAPG
jgi:hypothetical protein